MVTLTSLINLHPFNNMTTLMICGYVICGLAVGGCIGSYTGSFVYRIPRHISLIGRSQCPTCASPIPAWWNMPVLSWLLLRGKSRCCNQHISLRYELCELPTAVLGIVCVFLLNWRIDIGIVAAWIILPVIVSVWTRRSLKAEFVAEDPNALKGMAPVA